MARLHLELLGGLRIYDEQHCRIDLSVKKAQSLLVYLALNAGQIFTRESLAKLLWTNKQDKQARHSLRQAITDLKKHIPCFGDIVEITHHNITLQSDEIKVDAIEFRKLASSSNTAELLRANELYKGGFLQDFKINSKPFTLWCEETSQQLQESFLNVLESLLEHFLLEGDNQRAVEISHTLLELVPIHESAHRNLMVLYSRQGQNDKMRKQYESCVKILNEMFSTKPEKQTTDLFQKLVARTNPVDEQLIQNDTQESELPLRFELKLAGLSSICTLLNDELNTAIKHNISKSFLFSGEETSGKTWLLSQIAKQFESRNIKVIRCSCSGSLDQISSPLQEFFTSMICNHKVKQDDIEEIVIKRYFHNNSKSGLYLASIFVLLNFVIPRKLKSLYSALEVKKREWLNYQICINILRKISERQPVAVIIDDIECSQPLFRKFIDKIISIFQENPVFFFFSSGSNVFSENQITNQIQQIELKKPDSTEITRRFKFNFTDQPENLLVAGWLEQLNISTSGLNSLPLLIEHIVQNLNSSDREALESATVFENIIDKDVWPALMGSNSYDPSALLDCGLLVEQHDQLEFRHKLVHKYLYKSLHVDTRIRYHIQAAAYYRFSNSFAYAHHMARSGSADTAQAYITAAIAAAGDDRYELADELLNKAEIFATREIDLYNAALHRGLTLLETDMVARAIQSFQKAQQHSQNEYEQCMTWFGMAIGLIKRKQYEPAKNLFNRCEVGMIHTADHLQQAKYYYYQSKVSQVLKSEADSLRYAKIALEHARQLNDKYYQALIQQQLGQFHLQGLRLTNATELLQQSIQIARDDGYGDIELTSKTMLAEVKLLQGDLLGATSDLEDTVKIASITNNNKIVIKIHSMLCMIDFYRAQYSRLKQHSEFAEELCRVENESTLQNHLENYELYALHHLAQKQEFDARLSSIKLWVDRQHALPSYNLCPVLAMVENDIERIISYLSNSLSLLDRLSGPEALECCFLSIEAAISNSLWEQVLEFADKLIILLNREPLPFFIMCAERTRVLAQVGQGQATEATRIDLVDLITSAKQLGLSCHIRAYETALKALRKDLTLSEH